MPCRSNLQIVMEIVSFPFFSFTWIGTRRTINDLIVSTLPTTASIIISLSSSRVSVSLKDLDALSVIHTFLACGKRIKVKWHTSRKKRHLLVARGGCLPNCVVWTSSYSDQSSQPSLHVKISLEPLKHTVPPNQLHPNLEECLCWGIHTTVCVCVCVCVF